MTRLLKPLVYIAGPYTAPDPVLNTRRAIEVGLAIHDSGRATPVIPHLTLLAHLVRPEPIDYWYRLDLDLLDHCHAVLRLPGDSRGADAEVAAAKDRNLPVVDTLNDLWYCLDVLSVTR